MYTCGILKPRFLPIANVLNIMNTLYIVMFLFNDTKIKLFSVFRGKCRYYLFHEDKVAVCVPSVSWAGPEASRNTVGMRLDIRRRIRVP